MRKRKASTTRRRRRTIRAANPVHHRVRRRRRARAHNPARRRRVTRHRRSNPGIGGYSGSLVGGAVAGLVIQKFAKGLASGFTSGLTGGSAFMGIAVNFAVAFGVGMLAKKVMPGEFGKGIGLGAMVSAGSDAANTLLPSLGMSGLGVYQPAIFAVPENPVMRGIPTPSVPIAAKGVGMLNASFGHSF